MALSRIVEASEKAIAMACLSDDGKVPSEQDITLFINVHVAGQGLIRVRGVTVFRLGRALSGRHECFNWGVCGDVPYAQKFAVEAIEDAQRSLNAAAPAALEAAAEMQAVMNIEVEMPQNEQLALIAVITHLFAWHPNDFTMDAQRALRKIQQAAIHAVKVNITEPELEAEPC